MRLPTTLAADSDAAAVAALSRYYDRPYQGDGAYVGAYFDSWSTTGDWAGEADRFMAALGGSPEEVGARPDTAGARSTECLATRGSCARTCLPAKAACSADCRAQLLSDASGVGVSPVTGEIRTGTES